ncbi:MAG: tetratricopeptide repeat protein [Flavobacteriaceae bacterium]|nr:tetratricopeptide repeat protein [Flavobacteriaceae bacterium]
MKKYIVLSLALMLCLFSFAQKKEIKTAEKAIKSNNFADAKAALQSAEALMSAMDEKTKAKFYFLKGQALYANGTGNDLDISEALNSFKMLKEVEEKSGKKTYTAQASEIKLNMGNAFIKKASDAYEQKNYIVASANFERAYRVSTSDTLYLYNSASVAVLGKKYDTALKIYDELMALGYTGITMEYYATDVETGKEQSFQNKQLRSFSIQGGSHKDVRDVKTKSKVGEIAKNIALIYVELGDNDKAIEAIEKAKAISPNDFNLLVSEANIRYKIGDKEKYKELIAEALRIEPNNVDLVFNLGVMAADDDDVETAKKYYNMAIDLDPKYTKAKMNMAALLLSQEQKIIDEMNALGSSAADDLKYDELKNSRQQLYKDAIPYLSSTLELEPNNLSAAKTLMNIYSAIDDMPNYKAMKAKVEELESKN